MRICTFLSFFTNQPVETQIAGLDDVEMKNLHELVRILAYRIRDIFSRSNLMLWDGKFEFAFSDENESGHRSFQLVDSIGPDELRLTYDGVQLSKESLRKAYRGSDWQSAMTQAKTIAKERGVQNWKRICIEELGQQPKPLQDDFLLRVSSMYTALSNAISLDLYGRTIFSNVPSIDEVADGLQEAKV